MRVKSDCDRNAATCEPFCRIEQHPETLDAIESVALSRRLVRPPPAGALVDARLERWATSGASRRRLQQPKSSFAAAARASTRPTRPLSWRLQRPPTSCTRVTARIPPRISPTIMTIPARAQFIRLSTKMAKRGRMHSTSVAVEPRRRSTQSLRRFLSGAAAASRQAASAASASAAAMREARARRVHCVRRRRLRQRRVDRSTFVRQAARSHQCRRRRSSSNRAPSSTKRLDTSPPRQAASFVHRQAASATWRAPIRVRK